MSICVRFGSSVMIIPRSVKPTRHNRPLPCINLLREGIVFFTVLVYSPESLESPWSHFSTRCTSGLHRVDHIHECRSPLITHMWLRQPSFDIERLVAWSEYWFIAEVYRLSHIVDQVVLDSPNEVYFATSCRATSSCCPVIHPFHKRNNQFWIQLSDHFR